jgi:hypothetical protein
MARILGRDLDVTVGARLKENAGPDRRRSHGQVEPMLQNAAATATLRGGPGAGRQMAAGPAAARFLGPHTAGRRPPRISVA